MYILVVLLFAFDINIGDAHFNTALAASSKSGTRHHHSPTDWNMLRTICLRITEIYAYSHIGITCNTPNFASLEFLDNRFSSISFSST